MKLIFILWFGLAMLALASVRSQKRRFKWLQNLSGSQKFFGGLAFVVVLLMSLNPEFLALGFLGDTAFFDMLVLAIGLQLHSQVLRGCRLLATALTRSLRWMGVPSPGLCYLLAASAVLINAVVCALQKVAQRILS